MAGLIFMICEHCGMPNQILNDTVSYRNLLVETGQVLAGETHPVSIMSTMACLLKFALPKVYWVGFYLDTGSDLTIGPYQGTLGCLRIAYDRGVCGRLSGSAPYSWWATYMPIRNILPAMRNRGPRWLSLCGGPTAACMPCSMWTATCPTPSGKPMRVICRK